MPTKVKSKNSKETVKALRFNKYRVNTNNKKPERLKCKKKIL